MKGKNKCKLLKEIRQKIAAENDIPYVTRECTYRGDCKGTCPRCEAELRYLERELEKRRRLGKTVAVAAVAAGLSLSLAACTPGNGTGSGGPNATLPQPTPGLGVEGADPLLPEPSRNAILGYYSVEGEIAFTEPATEPTEYELEGDVAYLPETPEELPAEGR